MVSVLIFIISHIRTNTNSFANLKKTHSKTRKIKVYLADLVDLARCHEIVLNKMNRLVYIELALEVRTYFVKQDCS